MNDVSRTVLVGAALAMLLVGCQKTDTVPATSSSQPSPTVATTPASIPATSTPDPSLPAATAKAAGTQDTTALQHKAAPQEEMTKDEESKAMPLPGQANDHSTTALDRSRSK
jgi:hypothetical protein